MDDKKRNPVLEQMMDDNEFIIYDEADLDAEDIARMYIEQIMGLCE